MVNGKVIGVAWVEPPRVTVVGSGYVGTVVSACLAALGRQGSVVEPGEAKLSSLQSGRLPFYEPGLEELVSGRTPPCW